MFRLTGPMAVVGTLCLATGARAQVPTVTTQPILPPDVALLNIEDLEEEDNVDASTIRLQWTTTFSGLGETFEYEVTYDRARSENSPNATIIEVFNQGAIDSVIPQGVAVSGRTYQHRMLPSQILKPAITSTVGRLPGCPEGVDCLENQPRNIVVRVFPSSAELDDQRDVTASWRFDVDVVPPPAPTQTEPGLGEQRLRVNWQRLTPEVLNNLGRNQEQIQFYEVLYCVATSSTGFVGYVPPSTPEPVTGDENHLPCSNPLRLQRIGQEQGSGAISDGLRVGVPVAMAVRAIDQFQNPGPLSNVQIGTPVPVTDFFELHRQLGGEEEGGFCFVATAAHGSYAHPVVRVLRAFRDHVLTRSPAGRFITRLYYENSPPWARWVAEDSTRQASARVGLLPVALLAAFVLAAPALGGILVGLVLYLRLRRRKAVATRGASAGLLALLVLSSATSAQADDRQRPESRLPVGLLFEFKVGPYLPRMGDEEFADDAFRRSFGEYEDDQNGVPRFADGPGVNPLFNLGSELQLWRGYGSAVLYGSAGFARFQGSGLDEDGLPTSDDTTLNIVPLTLQAGYRADFIVKYTPIPLVPYVRGGLAYYIYWVTDGQGNLGRVQNPNGDDFVGQGGKFGLVGTAGLALLLNFFDQRSSRTLYNTTSIRGTYLFFEGMIAEVDGFGDSGFDFSDLSFNGGLSLEW